jgi:hypothetical protein
MNGRLDEKSGPVVCVSNAQDRDLVNQVLGSHKVALLLVSAKKLLPPACAIALSVLVHVRRTFPDTLFTSLIPRIAKPVYT